MKRTVILGMGLIALAVWGVNLQLGHAAEGKRRAETQTFMRMKLAWSQNILEGLTLEKFDAVSKNSIRLREMTASNAWFVIRQPDYMTSTTNFQKSVDALYLAAVDKNLDGATEAYQKVMKRCVECHRLVRLDQRSPAAREK